MADYAATESRPVSGWAVSGMAFAATMLVMIGAFQVVSGLAAIFDDEFFAVTPNYVFRFDVTAWGWVHLVLGALLVVAGIALFGQRAWAGIVAIILAVLSAVANFLFIPHYPVWSLVVIALDVWVIWSLTRPGVIET